jgi:hypothetical protein
MWYIIYLGMIASAIQFPSNVICFDENRLLRKNDFKSLSAGEKDRKAFGDFGISYYLDQNAAIQQVEICAYFNPYRSYCASDAPAEALLHEQYRWKIYQLAKLEMIQSYHHMNLAFANDKTQMLLDDVKLKYASMDRQFNATTKYGKIPEINVKWHARIDSLHAVLKTYQDSIFYIR